MYTFIYLFILLYYIYLYIDCTNEVEKSQAICDLLVDHGISGRPTIAKCRRLHKKVLKVKREIAQLDKSVIIENTGGF